MHDSFFMGGGQRFRKRQGNLDDPVEGQPAFGNTLVE
jgi:hypothetical protein